MDPSDAPAAPRLHSSDLPEVEPDHVPPAPREIDENTPLSSLTAAEIAQLTEKMLNDPSTRTKLIAEITQISVLRAEYLPSGGPSQDSQPSVVKQLDWLVENGYTHFRRAARDGNCFYRSLAFSYLDRILHAPDARATVARFRAVLASKETALSLAFEDDIHKEFSEQLYTLLQLIEDFGVALTTEDLLDRVLDVSDYVSYFFRLVASAEIRTNPSLYLPFIFAELDLPDERTPTETDIAAFCQRQIEAVDTDVDHLAMMALCNALRITLKLATLNAHLKLDSRKVEELDVFTPIQSDDAMDKDLPPILMLFRPGHYDILLTAAQAAR
ncbi:cysteine proteinase [Mycena crocata]|nr:cysteine proteinase [Mycena crocata]